MAIRMCSQVSPDGEVDVWCKPLNTHYDDVLVGSFACLPVRKSTKSSHTRVHCVSALVCPALDAFLVCLVVMCLASLGVDACLGGSGSWCVLQALYLVVVCLALYGSLVSSPPVYSPTL